MMSIPGANWTCAGVCGQVYEVGRNLTVCCVTSCKYQYQQQSISQLICYFHIDQPPGLLNAWWWPWVAVCVGVVGGLLVTVALVAVVAALVQLLLHGCDPRRAFPTSPCWHTVSLQVQQIS